jgi:hypothetical protein
LAVEEVPEEDYMLPLSEAEVSTSFFNYHYGHGETILHIY